MRTQVRKTLFPSWFTSRPATPIAGAALLLCGLHTACGPQEESALLQLDLDAPFVMVPRAVSAQTKALRQNKLHGLAAVDQVGLGDDFYLAINKKELGTATKWFLSSYLRQNHPAGVYNSAAVSLGTRVVSFKQQNGRLYVFDTDSRKKTSDFFDPELLVDAYQQVAYPPFDRLPGSSQFVLFDPAQGLNRFSVVGDAYAGGSGADRVKVELSFSQKYRETASKDGITYEMVFAGYGEKPDPNNDGLGEDNLFRVAGTLGIGLRRYNETMGFKEGPVAQIDGQDLYFRAQDRLIPNEAAFAIRSIKWGVSAGKPVEFVVSDSVDKLQADPRFAGYDLFGAISKGVTNWNSVFGFDALKVRKGTKDDDFGQDDKNFIIVDSDPNFGAAFANWRSNPNTGEIRGASVYFSPIFVEIADIIFDDDPPMPLKLGTVDKPKLSLLNWDSIGGQKMTDNCMLWAPIYKGSRPERGETERLVPRPRDGAAFLTKKQKVEQYITHTILHEIGHTLGLRHNFKGSLKFNDAMKIYTSSVMEYVDDFDAVNADKPQSYDIDAIKLLYGLSTTRPTDKFCNDSGVAVDPDCTTFDRFDDPYTKTYLDDYLFIMKDYMDGTSTVSPNTTLNAVLNYVRAAQTTTARTKALNDLWNTMGYGLKVGALDPMKLAMKPGYGARADVIVRRIFQRLVIESLPAGSRFSTVALSSTIRDALFAEAVKQLANTDKVRSVDTRRMLAGWMSQLQTIDAYKALAVGASTLDGEIRAGIADPIEAIKAESALKYMDKLLNEFQIK